MARAMVEAKAMVKGSPLAKEKMEKEKMEKGKVLEKEKESTRAKHLG